MHNRRKVVQNSLAIVLSLERSSFTWLASECRFQGIKSYVLESVPKFAAKFSPTRRPFEFPFAEQSLLEMAHDQDYIREFVAECREGLDRIDNVLVALEATPGDRSGLDIVFRSLHTIKGNAGFLDFPKLGALAHSGESLLSTLFGGTLTVSGDVAEVLLKLVDAIRAALLEIESTGSEASADHKPLIAEIERWTRIASSDSGTTPPVRRETKPAPLPAPPPMESTLVHSSTSEPQQQTTENYVKATVKDGTQPSPKKTDNLTPVIAAANPIQDQPIPEANPPSGDSSFVSMVGSKVGESGQSTFIRVQIDHLDELMNLVGEMVLVRNRILQVSSTRLDDELTEPIQRLNRLTAALQDGVMRTRMQPVRNAWRKYPRIVRDLAKQCGKQCEIELQGGDTELDKSMLEAIADPLVHLVRNAIDHGIEKPYLRKIKGKPETGRLLVRAFQESGQVHIEVSDDGAGLDLERIRKKAIEAGIIAAERAHQVSESDLRNSVFLPGFTTADKVTNLSGRGVGMDVVKTCIEQIGGTIELQTQKDIGTTIRLTVPLTLAIVPAVMVRCGSQRFAIPQINVVEMLRLTHDDMQQCERFHDSPVLRLRGELVPMAELSTKLKISSSNDAEPRTSMEIVVLKTGTRRYALLVDEIGDAQEIVVKPLGELFSGQAEYSGAALMGDGNIALILDVLGIARNSGLLAEEQAMFCGPVTVREDLAPIDEQVLVCRVDGERQVALPLCNVVCLEQVPTTSIEHTIGGMAFQYRGEIMPLQELSGRSQVSDSADVLSVVIYKMAESQVGLWVDQILDVADRPADLKPIETLHPPGSHPRVIATGIVLGRITDFIQVI